MEFKKGKYGGKPYNRKTLKTKGKMGKEKKQKTKMFHVKHF